MDKPIDATSDRPEDRPGESAKERLEERTEEPKPSPGGGRQGSAGSPLADLPLAGSGAGNEASTVADGPSRPGFRARFFARLPPPLRPWLAPGRLALVFLVALALFALWQWITWPDVARLAEENPETTAFIEDVRRTTGGDVSWRWVPYERISPHLKRAVLVSEDIGFFDHDGFEPTEMRAALRDAWDKRELPRGASTITQQTAKNLWLSPSRNPWRKVEEAILTRQLEARLDKRRILEIYLNVVQLGPDVFGAEAASRRYFGKSAAELGEREAAQLAASLPRPRSWHPGVDSRGYRAATERTLGRMGRAGWLWNVI